MDELRKKFELALNCPLPDSDDSDDYEDAHSHFVNVSKGYTSPSMVLLMRLKLKAPLVHIINHEKFIDGKFRQGSAKDVAALKETFGKLNCEVNEISNPTKNQVIGSISTLVGRDFRGLSALVVIILSHGEKNDIIKACDNEKYHLKTHVLDPICSNETLKGKPKILIVQACKGDIIADAIQQENGYYLICYSTSEGFLSYRNRNNGSIYIQTLCKVMDQLALKEDFTDIIEKVNWMTKQKSIEEGYKQVPSTDGKLLVPFRFGQFVDYGVTSS